MKAKIGQLVFCLSMCTSVLYLALSPAMAQQDTVEFKFIPKYYPEKDADFISIPPPEMSFKPEIVFPNDPKLYGRNAKVFVNVLVDTNGAVRDARVMKSTDEGFNKYALKYANQYKFKFTKEAVRRIGSAGKARKIWISIPIVFGQ